MQKRPLQPERKSSATGPVKDTSWHDVASWYDKLLQGGDTYQAHVIAPNLARLMDITSGDQMLDIACGQGFFSELFHKMGAKVTGVDLGVDLIALAKKRNADITYHVASSDAMTMLSDGSSNKAVSVLALQNTENVRGTFIEVFRTLKKGGQFFIVMNHPSFRIPKGSSWGIDAGTHYRRVDYYMSERQIAIDMHPGEKDSTETMSFHRPLQWYMKHAGKAGFVMTHLEEWISHRQSQKGPHQAEEDRMRKEIPLFLCMVLKKI